MVVSVTGASVAVVVSATGSATDVVVSVTGSVTVVVVVSITGGSRWSWSSRSPVPHRRGRLGHRLERHARRLGHRFGHGVVVVSVTGVTLVLVISVTGSATA